MGNAPEMVEIDPSWPMVVSWGGGRDSTAMLVGLAERGRRPDLILFADTGGEKPETYAYLEVFGAWLARTGFPPVTIVRNDGMYPTLEGACLANETLPPSSLGFHSCAERYKVRPQDKFLKTWPPAVASWAGGGRVRKAIEFEATEMRRVSRIVPDRRFAFEFPLVEWGWGLPECIAAIGRAGLPVPVKSACFFCGFCKKAEVLDLADRHPDLFARAVDLERLAQPNLESVRGMGRHWSWAELAAADRETRRRLPETPPIACMCFDGEA